MTAFNFSGDSTGLSYLRMWVFNDTDQNGFGDDEVLAWDGTQSKLNSTNYIYFTAAPSYGSDGGPNRVKIEIILPESGLALQGYSGTLYLWFTEVC